MKVDKIVVPQAIEEKLATKHSVKAEEAKYLLLNQPRIRYAEQGHIPGEDVYAAFGRTLGGRYLAVFFVYKPVEHTAIVISARDMSRTERRQYDRK